MVETIHNYELLEETVDLKDQLASKDIFEMIVAMGRAVEAIRKVPGGSEAISNLDSPILNLIRVVRDQISSVYSQVVMPHEYARYWAAAQRELHDALTNFSSVLQQFTSLPASAPMEQRHAAQIKYEDLAMHHMPFFNQPAFLAANLEGDTFNVWKKETEGKIKTAIDKCKKTQEKLERNIPKASNNF